ncbi:hypothetical protein FF011L_10510 [Roseimaritima multifibrata]|uniref:HEAT repeat protein n=1 Tax=Roseimaritima multifibrata TaxID=1930274 RepID=A0A517MBN2_9BACT|nr:HEAT repeat domain-containing protein [Roseimaritima multifibrata]QDS92309.1 hypothetical protein FF011L_10510 [Roseimaritima multifibrata]
MDGTLSEWIIALSRAPEQRAEAAKQLANAKQSVKPAILALVRAAGDRDDSTRMWAAEALETAGAPDPGAVPALIQFLEPSAAQADGESAYWAARILRRLGPAASAATPALTAAVKNSPYLAVREEAVAALGRIGPAAREASETLSQAAQSGPPRLARLAMIALESIRGMAA